MRIKISGIAVTRALVAGALVVFAASSGANANNLIADGSFNIAPLPTASDQYYLNYSTSLPGNDWFVLDNNVDVVNSGASPYAMTPPTGSCCVVDLVGFGSTGGIYQSFSPIVSGLYKLSVEYANNFYSTSSAAAAVEIGTSAGDSSILSGSITHSGSSFGNMLWDVYTATVDLTSGSTYFLSFDTTSGANSGGVVIADVSLSNTTGLSAAPLPSTWTMLIAGFLGLGFMAFRGAKRSSAALAAA